MPKTTTTVDLSFKSPQLIPSFTYRLSERSYWDLGWTVKPLTSKHVELAVTMKAKFANSTSCLWFKEREKDVVEEYSDGNILYLARKNGTGQIYYPNGKMAIRIENSESFDGKKTVWVYGCGEVGRGGQRDSDKLCAVFDSLGNGIVYDRCLRKKLVYNQNEGIMYQDAFDRPVRWKWHSYKQTSDTVEEDEFLPAGEELKKGFRVPESDEKGDKKAEASSANSAKNKSLTKSDDSFLELMDHFRFLNTGKIVPKTVAPIKPIVLRLNRYLSVWILDQANVFLYFFAGARQVHVRLGILYNPFDKLEVTTLEQVSGPRDVLCPYESFPAKTRSLIKFRRLIEKAKCETRL